MHAAAFTFDVDDHDHGDDAAAAVGQQTLGTYPVGAGPFHHLLYH
jgi:hypothetical protein